MNKPLLPPTAATCKAVTTDWSARRRWWAAKKKRTGCDWPGLWAFDRDVVALAIRARSDPAVLDEYSNLLPTWGAACRRADAEYRERQAKLASTSVKAGPRLAVSTLDAVDYLLKQDDWQALKNFIAKNPPSEAKQIIAYAKERKLCP